MSLAVTGGGESDVLTRTHYIAATSSPAGLLTTTVTYAYDPLYRLTSATYSSGEVYTYTYDSVGNRLKKGVSGEVTEYVYDDANRLTSAGGVEYTWDQNGNLLDDGEQTYEYDYANRLVQVVTGTFTTTFTYNGDGHRVAKSENGATTNYVVAVLGLSQVLIETTDGSSIRYIYGHDLLAEHDGEAWAWHLNDGLGSVRQLAGASGNVTLAQGYTPFGVPLWSAGEGTTGYGFTGERWEAYSELVFLRARYYEPGTGRFVSRDTWPGNHGSPQTFNGWTYVANNPLVYADPSGHQRERQVPEERYWVTEKYGTFDRQHFNTGRPGKCLQDIKDLVRECRAGQVSLKQPLSRQFLGARIEIARFEGTYEVHGDRIGDGQVNGAFLAVYEDWSVPPQLTHYCFSLGCYYVNPDWFSTGFDEPGDWWNVEFGIKMFRTYGKHMSLCQFQDFLAIHGHWLTPGKEQEWHWAERPGEWPYKVGYFDGPNESKYEVPIMMLLVPW